MVISQNQQRDRLSFKAENNKIIAILNNQCDGKEEESVPESIPQSEDSPRTKLRKKLGAAF